MSSDDEGPVRTGPGSKRRRLQRACDVCRKKKIRCDGIQMPGHQCTNCTDYGLDCTYVETAKKRGPPKSYIERLEKRVEKLQELLSQISPEAIEHLNGPPASTASHPLPTPSQSTGEWAPYDPAPRRFIRHLGSSRSPSPPPDDDESTRYLKDDFERLHITANDPRYFGKSSGIKLIRDTLDLKNMCIGKDNTVPPEQTWSGIRRPWITPPALTVPTFTFPDPDLITSLIDLYFKHVNCYFPLLHRPTFERDVSSGLHHTNSAFAGTLILLCAVAARYSDDLRVMDDPKEPGEEPDPHSSGWKWFSQVPLVRATPLAPPCLYELQFFALVGQFLQASSVPQACWTIVGIGIRVAQDVGAHRRKSRGEHTVEDELWNRAFWVLVCLDRLFSSSTGRPCSIHDEDFDIEMPVECDDEYWEHPDPELRWRQPTPEKTPSKIVYFNVYIRLNQILAFLLRTVYATNKSRILHGFGGQQWEENIVSELDSALNAWMATLPDHLRWDPSRPDEIYFNQSASLFCFYQHIQILVHRPFIPSPHQPNKALSFPSLAICTNAARACSNALDIQRKRYGTAPPPLTTTAFSAGVILLLGIWGGRRSGHLTESYDKEMHDVKKCMDVLKLAEVRWYLAGRLNDILRELAFVGDVPLPQRPSDSPPAMQKRERSLDGEESGDDVFTPPSQSDSNPRASGRFKKQPETLLKGVVSRRTLPETSQSLAQLQTLPEYDFEYHRPPQQALHSSLNPQQQWPRQGATQPAQKQYDNYIRPHAPLQMQHPNTLPGFGQVFGPTGYSEDVGAMSSFVVPRGSDTGPGLRHGYPYRAGTEAAGTLGMDVDMGIRQRTDMGLGMGQPGALGANDDQAFTLWSDVPPGFQYAQWDNYVANLDAQNTPRQGQYTPHG